MKKILITLIAIGVILASCKKEHKKDVIPQNGLQKVTFKAGFSISTGYVSLHPLTANSLQTNSTPDTALTNHIDELYYMVFDASGNNLHNIKQLSTDTAFGHYVDNLHPGTYTIAIAGGTGFSVTPGTLSTQYCTLPPFNDFFFGKTSITVGDVPASQSVTLNRETSKIVVNIKDALPMDPKATFLLSFSGIANQFFIGSETPGATTSNGVTVTIPAAARGTTGFQASTIFMYKAPFLVNLTCQADQFTVYGYKSIANVNGAVNKVTILTGNLFGGSGTSQTGGFNSSLDTAWTTPLHITFP